MRRTISICVRSLLALTKTLPKEGPGLQAGDEFWSWFSMYALMASKLAPPQLIAKNPVDQKDFIQRVLCKLGNLLTRLADTPFNLLTIVETDNEAG